MSEVAIEGAEQSILLSGADWRIVEESTAQSPVEDILEGKEELDWINAQVPGNIQADLERNRRLLPLWYGTGDPNLLDVGRKNWWYRKELSLPADFRGRHLELVFDGVDYSCEVWVNGQKAGTHDGMFQRFAFDVTEFARFDEVNSLAVRIAAMPEELVPYLVESDGKMSGESTPYFFVNAMDKTRQVLKGLKNPATFSYDWGTNIWALGIWKDVTLRATGTARIEWVQVGTKLKQDFQSATVHVQLDVISEQDAEATLSLVLQGNGADIHRTLPVCMVKGSNRIEADLEIENPALWWPNGYGGQPLYELSTTLQSIERGETHDTRETRFGIREIRWEQVEGAPPDFMSPFRLMVNGRAVRTMGSNLVATDLLPGRIGDRGRHYIALAKACHMTALRQHGGQVIFPESLYDAADELGVMLIVDFPVANCVPEGDPEFVANFEETARNIIRQLRNHPSIIEWSGGNELNWLNGQDYPALHALERVTAEEDDRLFRATCPAQGSRHAPWDYNPHIHYEQYNRPILDNQGAFPMMRYGEFGCQTPSNLEVWHRDIPPESQWPIREDDPTLIRKNAVQAVFAPDFWLAKSVIEERFGALDNLEMLIKAGQFIGAEGLRYAMDALRAKGKTVGGFTSWDYNEPWPNGAGSFLVDYDGRPVMMYYFAKQALSPLSLQLRYDSLMYNIYDGIAAELLLVSDLPAEARGLTWSWVARDRRGRVFGTGEGSASIQPQEVRSLSNIAIKPPLNTTMGPVFLELKLTDETGAIRAERLTIFGAKGTRAPFRGLLKPDIRTHDYGIPYVTTAISGGAVATTTIAAKIERSVRDGDTERLEVTLENTAEMTAIFCELRPMLEYRTDLVIDNQFAFLPPGERRTVTITAPAEPKGGLTLAQTGWTVDCWNAESVSLPPSDDVILFMGRKDSMCREFSTCLCDSAEATEEVRLLGKSIEAASVPYLLRDEIAFTFEAESGQGNRPARLRIHTADRSPNSGAEVEVTLNGVALRAQLPEGLGIQKENPPHLALPASLEFSFAPSVLKAGTNTLRIRVLGDGWFTWDALDLVTPTN